MAAPNYTDPNTGTTMNSWAVNEAMIPNLLGGTLPATLNSALWTSPTIRPKGTWIKGPKKTKLVQSAWCEVCKLCCNSKDVLELHKLGEKAQEEFGETKCSIYTCPCPCCFCRFKESNNWTFGEPCESAEIKKEGSQLY